MKDEKKEVLHLTEKHVRYGAACLLLGICLTMIVGYYWGKKKAYEEFIESCRSDSFNDRVAATLCALYDAGDEVLDNSADAPEDGLTGSDVDAAGQAISLGQKPGQQPQQETQYFAELIGFGTLSQAKHYATRLKNKQVKAYVVEHKSRTAQGKTRTWYQVITAPMDYEALQALVDRIKIEDHLQGVTLVEFSPKYKERFERALA